MHMHMHAWVSACHYKYIGRAAAVVVASVANDYVVASATIDCVR